VGGRDVRVVGQERVREHECERTYVCVRVCERACVRASCATEHDYNKGRALRPSPPQGGER
jgi:hypothetical protein